MLRMRIVSGDPGGLIFEEVGRIIVQRQLLQASGVASMSDRRAHICSNNR